jgi:stage V sporulation protein G
MIRITEVKISLRGDDKLRAFATVTLDGCFVVRGLKVIRSARGTFVAMPARRKSDGTFQDVAHPINVETRAYLEREVLDAYWRAEREAGGDGGDDSRPDSGDESDHDSDEES